MSTAAAVDPKSNENLRLRFESQMANVVSDSDLRAKLPASSSFKKFLVLRFCTETKCDCLPDLTAAQQAVVVRVLVNACNGIHRFPRKLSTVEWKY